MKSAIFNYFYNYNHFIKHSGINRKTPMEALEKFYSENKEIFKENLTLFTNKDKKIFYNYRVGLDN